MGINTMMRWKAGHPLQPTAVLDFSSNAKDVTIFSLPYFHLPCMPLCARRLLELIVVSALKPNLRHDFMGLNAPIGWKDGKPLHHTATVVSLSNTKHMASLVLY